MIKKYDGPERRSQQADGRDGRRSYDWHCYEHRIIQDNTKAHREAVCRKIAALNAEVDRMVSWRIFAFLFSFSVVVAGAGFGFFGIHLDKLSDKQERSMEIITNRQDKFMETIKTALFEIATNQAVMSEQIESIKKRQDVLRDAHLRDRESAGKKGAIE